MLQEEGEFTTVVRCKSKKNKKKTSVLNGKVNSNQPPIIITSGSGNMNAGKSGKKAVKNETVDSDDVDSRINNNYVEKLKLLPVPPWLSDVIDANDVTVPIAQRLGREIENYWKYTLKVVEKVAQPIEDAITHISDCVQAIWPEATVTCFGSFASGLWLPSSDVDVVVMGISTTSETDTNAGKTQFLTDTTKPLEQIASRLRIQPWVKHIDVVSGAKVPVAKVVLAANGLRVDISIENMHTRLGIEASTLVREYVDHIPMLQPVMLVLKQFLREKGLNNAFTGGLSSYPMTLMAMYFLEVQGMTEAKEPGAMGQFLLDFLEYYGMTFQYSITGISLKPEAFGEYFLAPTLTATTMMAMPQLVIDDPVYPNGQHNAAAGAFAIARVISALENAFYAVSFHRPNKFTPTLLSQLVHWSGHEANKEVLSSG